MKKPKTFNIYEDPTHAWIKVKRSFLQDLGILQDVSNYSYERKAYVYLEEDNDYSLFCKAMEERKIPFKLKTHIANRDSKIRNYNYFEYNSIDQAYKEVINENTKLHI